MKFRQLITFIFCLLPMWENRVTGANRLPTHYAPDLEIVYDTSLEPIEKGKRSVASLVLKRANEKRLEWEKFDQMLNFYDLDSYHGQVGIEESQKKRTIERALLKYLDKSLMEKIKNSDKNSPLAKVRKAEKTLNPKSEKSLSSNFKFKFRAKVLRGKGQFILINPYFDADAKFSLSGRNEFNFSKYISVIDVNAKFSYIGHEDRLYSEISKNIIGNLSTRVTSTSMMEKTLFTKESDNRLELIYSLGF